MYLAMHDALNAIVRKFRPYAFVGTDPSAHPIAAAAQAAHDVMNHIYPTRQAENDVKTVSLSSTGFVVEDDLQRALSSPRVRTCRTPA